MPQFKQSQLHRVSQVKRDTGSLIPKVAKKLLKMYVLLLRAKKSYQTDSIKAPASPVIHKKLYD